MVNSIDNYEKWENIVGKGKKYFFNCSFPGAGKENHYQWLTLSQIIYYYASDLQIKNHLHTPLLFLK